ncbi:Vitamin D(3) 25-hydroxylase [Sinobacterium norvegicum]|uniref:Vitamin D(3) 25-hydroxylase n=1 Tax=Sinobacterium norvegicum TaxID=1641715 RepID=A0ABN8EJL2_9GAMM|nr:cytochrome P450 [Sinobacterium norvegicum]CAH0992566.1 Vitamin D(3) 25-hydroxylase [Sinobacterium norvegicum]
MSDNTAAKRPAGKCPMDFNFFDEETLNCPYDFYKTLQEQAPVYNLPDTNIYMVTRHADVKQLLKDTETYSNNFTELLKGPVPDEAVTAIYAKAWQPVDTMITADPPRHRAYRTLVNKVFSAKRVNEMEDYMTAIVHELIDNIIDKGECDFVREFTTPLPVYVIADQLGVPRKDLEAFKRWSDSFARRLSQLATPEEEIEDAENIVEFQFYFADMIAKRREEPKDDMISDLVSTTISDPDSGETRPLNMEELQSILQQFLVAGNETTTSAITGGMVSLIQNPEQLKALQDDPSKIANAVEEILRMESPSAGIWRVVKKDSEIHGVKVPKDSLLMLRYHAANRDQELFDTPDSIDIDRDNAGDHIAFGQGIHFCPGAMLARKEMNVAFEALLSRLTNFAINEDKSELEYWPNIVLRGLKGLHLTFDKRD